MYIKITPLKTAHNPARSLKYQGNYKYANKYDVLILMHANAQVRSVSAKNCFSTSDGVTAPPA
ncbi:hypothetical protein BDZ89DRAFT_534700 [Hymenopellis radicata]|nr:hypothetical protein BDZ89DRAFT_534700 [Hymenopellis radicata]